MKPPPGQLTLFDAAPGTLGFRGRTCLRAKLQALVDRARMTGCTHVEVSQDGVLFVLASAVDRIPGALYIPLDAPHILSVLMARTINKARVVAGAD